MNNSGADAQDVSTILERVLVKALPDLHGYVHRRMAGLLATRESASDLVQSVCGEVVKHLERFEHGGDDEFRHWMFRMADRKIIDRHRYWHAKRRDAARDDQASVGRLGGVDTPSADAIGRETIDRLQHVLEALPTAARDVIVLHRVLGLSHEEIGAVLDLTPAAVRQRLHRALADLAVRLPIDES